MKLGIGSYAYAWSIGVAGHPPARPMTAAGLLAEAHRLGAEVVQICDNLAPERMADDEAAGLADEARGLGISVEVGARGIGEDYLRACLRVARIVGSPILRVVVDSPGDEPTPAQCARRLRAMRDDFAEAGALLAIENHDRFTCSELAALIEAIGDDWAGICLDTVNSFGALEGPGRVIEALAPLCLSLHVKDFRMRRVDHAMGFVIEGAPCGRGRLDIAALLDRVRCSGRDPNAIIELWTPPADSLDRTIERERAWAEESVRCLRTHLLAATASAKL
jgi:sugar phosphate isomerase/epimerase